jgi:hypothetical protein
MNLAHRADEIRPKASFVTSVIQRADPAAGKWTCRNGIKLKFGLKWREAALFSNALAASAISGIIPRSMARGVA